MIIKPRTKTCKNAACGSQFIVQRMGQTTCCAGCLYILNKDAIRKGQERADRKDTAARKEALKTRQQWLAEAQQARNAVVRERDRLDGCISCDKPATWDGQWHASHYLSVGAHPAARFDFANIHKSCSVCNSHLSGNLRAYRPRLIDKVGIKEVDRLESLSEQPLKLSIDDLRIQIAADRALLRKMIAERDWEPA